MAENKKQHYVPKTYLKHFSNGKVFSVLNIDSNMIYENVSYARTIIQAGINNVIMRQGEGVDNYIILPAKELQWVLDGDACE